MRTIFRRLTPYICLRPADEAPPWSDTILESLIDTTPPGGYLARCWHWTGPVSRPHPKVRNRVIRCVRDGMYRTAAIALPEPIITVQKKRHSAARLVHNILRQPPLFERHRLRRDCEDHLCVNPWHQIVRGLPAWEPRDVIAEVVELLEDLHGSGTAVNTIEDLYEACYGDTPAPQLLEALRRAPHLERWQFLLEQAPAQ